MRRDEFTILLGGVALLQSATRAQQKAIPVIGYLASLPDVSVPYVAAFRQGLNEAGFTEGRNVAIEFRYAEGHLDRFPDLAADLVQHHVAVILVSLLAGLRAAEAATNG